MKRSQLANTAAVAAILTGLFSVPAVAQSISDGDYVATWGPTECSIISVSGNSMGYVYGVCESGQVIDEKYRANKVSRRGDTVHIDQATFTIDRIDGSRLIGAWKLGDYTANKIFSKQ